MGHMIQRIDTARVAQLVEQRTENPRVGGSNPPPGTILLPVRPEYMFASRRAVEREFRNGRSERCGPLSDAIITGPFVGMMHN